MIPHSPPASSTHAALIRALREQSHVHGHADLLLAPALTTSPGWADLAASWNDLPLDDSMPDGGKYRFRRYSQFRLHHPSRTLSVLGHAPYRQTEEVNPLQGGMARRYGPLTDETQGNPALRRLLMCVADALSPLHPSGEWFLQVFQNRVVAEAGQPGQPTPEGVHRAGVDFKLSVMIQRRNIAGGESLAYAQDGQTRHHSVMLMEPGDFILLDDRKLTHIVQPILPRMPMEPAYRDMLVATFTRRAASGPMAA